MPRTLLDQTIDDLLAEARGQAKVAAAREPATPPSTPAHATRAERFRKLASALAELPEPRLSFDTLYAVKSAAERGEALAPPPASAPAPPGGSGRVGALRKVAQVLHAREREVRARHVKQAELVLRALPGLHILREETEEPAR